MAIVVTAYTPSIYTTVNSISYSTANFAITAGDGIIVNVGTVNTSTTSSMYVAVGTGGGTPTITFSQVQLDVPNGAFAWVNESIPASNTGIQINVVCGDQAGGAVIDVARITGHDPTAFVRGFAVATGASTATLCVSMTQAPIITNGMIGFARNNSNPFATTIPTNWTEVQIGGFNTPATGSDFIKRNSGETNQAITWGVSPSAWGAGVFEITASFVASVFPYTLATMGYGR